VTRVHRLQLCMAATVAIRPTALNYARMSWLRFEGKNRALRTVRYLIFAYCQRRTKCKILSAHEWLLGAVENLYDEPQNVPGGRMAQLIK